MPFLELDIFMKPQCRSYHCYAAVVQAVVRHYTGQQITQRAIEDVFGATGYQDPVDYLAPLDLIQPKSSAQYGYSGIPSWQTVTTEIAHNRPIIIYLGYHYILLVGYEGEGARDPKRLYIFLDPLEPLPEGVEYGVLKVDGYPVGDKVERVRGYYLTRPPKLI